MSLDIDIHRLGFALRLSGDSQRVAPVARRLGELACGRLTDALARVDVDDPVAGDDGIVFIERLVVQCAANTAWDDDAIAAHIARRLAVALESRLSDPALLRFRDRADFVAAALVAFADASAAGAWWLEEFDGLQSLSASGALRTLVINEGQAGSAALARLTDTALRRVLDTLLEGDATRLLAWMSVRDGGSLPPAALWSSAGALATDGRAAPWLRLLVLAERERPGSGGSVGWRCLRDVATLHELARRGELDLRGDLRDALRRALGAGDWLVDAAEADLQALVAELAVAAADAAPSAPWLRSAHGGFFVLLGRLQRSGWPLRWHALMRQALRDSPAAGPARPALDAGAADALCRALAMQLAATALAGDASAGVLADAAVRAACGVDDAAALVAANTALASAALQAVLAEPGARPVAAALVVRRRPRRRTLARWLEAAAAWLLLDAARAMPGLAGSTPDFLRTQALSLGVAVRVCADGAATEARLGRAPLDVLLLLAGVKRVAIELPGVAVIRCCGDEA